jgi:hypothetical protein
MAFTVQELTDIETLVQEKAKAAAASNNDEDFKKYGSLWTRTQNEIAAASAPKKERKARTTKAQPAAEGTTEAAQPTDGQTVTADATETAAQRRGRR